MDSESIKISHFHGYWLTKFEDENNSVLMFGNICHPYPDWCFYFNHRIDLERGKFEFFIPEFDEEIYGQLTLAICHGIKKQTPDSVALYVI
jgi:hypothetical protein